MKLKSIQYKFISFIFIMVLFFSKNYSQNIDSLFDLLPEANTEQKIEIYSQLVDYYDTISPKQSLLYTKKILELAKKTGLTEEKKIKFYIIISQYYIDNNIFDSAKLYIDTLNEIEKKINDKTTKAKVNFLYGNLFYKNGKYDKADTFLRKSLQLYEELEDTTSIIISLEYLGRNNYMKSNYSKAIEYFMQELKLADTTSYSEAEASAKNNIAMTYSTEGDYENALKFHKEALNIYKKLKNNKGLATVYTNIGNIYVKNKNKDSAFFYFSEALNYANILGDSLYIAICETNLAESYILFKKLPEARKHLLKAESFFKENNLNYYLSAIYTLYGKYYLSSNQNDSAEIYFKKSIELARKTDFIDIEIESYKQLTDLYYAEKNYKDAYLTLKQYYQIKDSVYSLENSLKISQLKLNYQTEKKEKQIQISKIKIEKQKKLLLFFEISFVIFIILSTVAAIFYRKLNNSYKKLVEKNIEIVKNKEFKEEINNKEEPENEISKQLILKEKLEAIDLPEEQIEKLKLGIEKFIKEKKFLDKDISLDKMAKMLETNKQYLSKYINFEYDLNFTSFINKYRIEEAQKIILTPKYNQYSLDGIAKIVGFKSRSSFYTSFKKFTGVTPAFFKKEMQTKQ